MRMRNATMAPTIASRCRSAIANVHGRRATAFEALDERVEDARASRAESSISSIVPCACTVGVVPRRAPLAPARRTTTGDT